MKSRNGRVIVLSRNSAKLPRCLVRYPWSDWMSRRTRFTLVRGVDFSCMTHGMTGMIRNHAAKAGLRASITATDNCIEVELMPRR